jgi:hypothetical protein
MIYAGRSNKLLGTPKKYYPLKLLKLNIMLKPRPLHASYRIATVSSKG